MQTLHAFRSIFEGPGNGHSILKVNIDVDRGHGHVAAKDDELAYMLNEKGFWQGWVSLKHVEYERALQCICLDMRC